MMKGGGRRPREEATWYVFDYPCFQARFLPHYLYFGTYQGYGCLIVAVHSPPALPRKLVQTLYGSLLVLTRLLVGFLGFGECHIRSPHLPVTPSTSSCAIPDNCSAAMEWSKSVVAHPLAFAIAIYNSALHVASLCQL